MNFRLLYTIFALSCCACSAHAGPYAQNFDFEGPAPLAGWSTELSDGSAVISDPQNPSNKVLSLLGNDMATISLWPTNTFGTLSIDVYDKAINATRTPLDTSYGPRWGILKQGAPGSRDALIASITYKTADLDYRPQYPIDLSNDGSQWYMYSAAGNGANDQTGNNSLFGSQILNDKGTADTHAAAPGRQVVQLESSENIGDGIGMWSTWIFHHPDPGTLNITIRNANVDFTWNILDPNLGTHDARLDLGIPGITVDDAGRAQDGSFSGNSEGWIQGISTGFNGVILKAGKNLPYPDFPRSQGAYFDNITFTPVPEPASMAIMLIISFAATRRK